MTLTTFFTRKKMNKKNFHLLALMGCFLIFVYSSCSNRQQSFNLPADARAGDFYLESAKIKSPHEKSYRYKAQQGKIIVPENRYNEDSRLIALPVIRFQSISDNPAEPVFFLSGGPGVFPGLPKQDLSRLLF